MTHRTQKTRMLMPRSRKLNLEALEPRICLTTYTSIDLFPLSWQDSSQARGCNDNGLVVGYSYYRGHGGGTGDPDWTPDEAVVWSVTPTGEVSVESLPGGGRLAYEVNNLGMIAGYAGTQSQGVIWTGTFGSYVAHDLDALEGFTASWATSISEPDTNGNVWVAGRSVGGGVDHGTLWQVDVNGTILSMTDLEPELESRAMDVTVIGNSVFVAGDLLPGPAVIWETDLDGTVLGRTDLETAETQTMHANGLNIDGDAVGQASFIGVGKHGFLYESGVFTDLGKLGDWKSEAHAINDNDVVVGYYGTQVGMRAGNIGDIQDAAFVWENGTMYKLYDLVSERTFRNFESARDVNTYGEIVGWGTVKKPDGHARRFHGFLARSEGGQQAPEANDDTYTTPPDTRLTVPAPGVLENDTDADGDSLTANLQTDVSHGSLTLNSDGSFVYDPAAGFTGTDSFTYRAHDGTAASNEVTALISVASESTDTYYSTDTPLAISDPHPVKGSRPTESFLSISGTGIVMGMLDVDVTIAHGAMSDLTVTLTSPQDLQKPLIYDGTEWNLEWPTDFWAEGLDGTWVLKVTDTVRNGTGGTLESWSMTVASLTGPGITVTPTSGLTTSEAGAMAAFQVVLDSEPNGLVRVNLVPSDTSEGRLEQANSDDVTLNFDATNWDDPQEIVIIGVDDPIADGDVFYTIITIVMEAFDPDYLIIDPDDVEVVNLDDGDDPAPLLAEFGSGSAATDVTIEQVQQVTTYALALWSAHLGVPAREDIQVNLTDLPAGRLGQADRTTIVVDVNASGAGWFVDPSPWNGSQFHEYSEPASNRFDLLTVVTHEIGHLLGYEHSADAKDLMAATLPLGTRRLPGLGQLQFEPRAAQLLPLPARPESDTTLVAESTGLGTVADIADERDLNMLLQPIVTGRLERTTSNRRAGDERALKDVVDEETQLLDEQLLQLLATR